jgi:hypothetical protein
MLPLRILFAGLLLGSSPPLAAQPVRVDSAAVVGVVRRYISAMTAQDTVFLRAASMPSASFVAFELTGAANTSDAASSPTVRTVDQFLLAQASRTSRFLGRIWSPRVSIEGPIAVLIAPYDVWLDGQFSYCGVDHYVLTRSGERWLVSQLLFTRHAKGCEPSPLGPPA